MNKIDIIKALLCESQGEQDEKEYPFAIGDKVFLRTVTLYYLGRIKDIKAGIVTLEDASWVQDTGSRLYDFLESGIDDKSEIEPIGIAHINLGNMIDCLEWKHELPRRQQ